MYVERKERFFFCKANSDRIKNNGHSRNTTFRKLNYFAHLKPKLTSKENLPRKT